MDIIYVIKLNKIYINDSLRKQYNIESKIISIEYKTSKYGVIMAKLRINKDKTITSYYHENKNDARNECMRNALIYFNKLKRKIQKEKKDIRNQKLTTKERVLFFFIFIGYLSLVLLYFGNYFNKNLFFPTLSIYSFLVSPIYFIKYDIGKCVTNRVLVRNSIITENVYNKTLRCLYPGDLLLFNNTKESFNEAVVKKKIVLTCRNPEISRFKTFTLPEGLGIAIRKSFGKYIVDVTSYQRDGEKKIFFNPNVDRNDFLFEKCFKYEVFSSHGIHYVKDRFVVNQNSNNLVWYFNVLSIYKNYIGAFFLSFTNYYEKDNEKNGFDNFKIYPIDAIEQPTNVIEQPINVIEQIDE